MSIIRLIDSVEIKSIDLPTYYVIAVAEEQCAIAFEADLCYTYEYTVFMHEVMYGPTKSSNDESQYVTGVIKIRVNEGWDNMDEVVMVSVDNDSIGIEPNEIPF